MFSLSDRHRFTSVTIATRKSTRARQTGAKTVPRKKAKKIEYPCGFCQQSCAADTILCSGSMTWFHRDCAKLTEEELHVLEVTGIDYLCSSCCGKPQENKFDYPNSLQRLQEYTGANKSWNMLKKVCDCELIFLRSYQFDSTVDTLTTYSHDVLQPDHQAMEILCKFRGSGPANYTPVTVAADGDCLFHSAIVLMTGSESVNMVKQLRVHTALEMIKYADY